MARALNVVRVNVPARVSIELYDALVVRSGQAGVPWDEARKAIAAQLEHVCRVAMHAQLLTIVDWSSQEWRSALERAGVLSHNNAPPP